MATLRQIDSSFRKSCAVGLLLSCYALFVEVKKELNSEYTALCDINEHISCTKAFSSEYGRGFGIVGSIFGEDSQLNQPNCVSGILFYVLLFIMSFSNQRSLLKLQLCLCIMSNFMSVYLAYILYFILQDFCLVCVGTYIVNAINLALSVSKWNLLKKEARSQISSRPRSKKE